VQLNTQSLEMKPQATKTAVLVGGAEDKVHGREILHTFFARAGSGDAHIAIILLPRTSAHWQPVSSILKGANAG